MVTDVTEIRPHEGPQEQFLSSPADIVIYGGAAGGGKSWAIVFEPLRHINNAEFGGVIFRRTSPEITNEGGLWDESANLYPLIGADPRITDHSWTFPSGAKITFGHLEYEKDLLKWQGSQIAFLGFDELTHFTKRQFVYMLSRNRSTCGIAPYVRATCNPDADSWVAEFVAWWIDEDSGYPIDERSGVVRYFVVDGNSFVWGDSPEELLEDYPALMPKSVTFIPAKLDDNPTLVENDPGYRANLLAQGKVDRERLLHGNWKICSTEGAEWEDHPEYFESQIWTDEWPDAFELSSIALDASKGRKSKSSDYSALVFVGLQGGLLWIDASVEKRSAETIVQDVILLHQDTEAMAVGVESNGFQDLFADLIDAECERQGVPPLPIHLIHNYAPKEDRIRSLEPYLSRRKLRIRNTEGGRLLFRQLRDFGVSDHDDGPDALEMAVRLLNHMHVEVAV